MSTSPTSMHDAIQARVSEFMEVLEKTTGEALAAQSEGVRASAELALLMQKAATQQVMLASIIAQRCRLAALYDDADGPLALLVQTQIEQLDAKAMEVLSQVGVPKKAATAALENFGAARRLDSNPINTLRIPHRNGQPAA